MPQPIDFQTEVARVSAAERIQEIAGRLSLAAQQRALIEQTEQQVRHETQVQDTQESEGEHIDTEVKRRNPYVGRRRRGKKRQDEAPREDSGLSRGEAHQLDISV